MALLSLSRSMETRATALTTNSSTERRARWTAVDLQRTYLDDVYRFVSRRLTRREDAEDVTAEVFEAAFRSLPKFRGDAIARTWLLGIARRKIADYLRRTGGRPEALWCETPALVNKPSDGPLPESAAMTAHAAKELGRILAAMPDDQRDALILQYADGLSIAEIAAVLGKSQAAANSLLQRARATVFREGRAYFDIPD